MASTLTAVYARVGDNDATHTIEMPVSTGQEYLEALETATDQLRVACNQYLTSLLRPEDAATAMDVTVGEDDEEEEDEEEEDTSTSDDTSKRGSTPSVPAVQIDVDSKKAKLN